MKENINLGDKSKFVPYGDNGVKNCLELCKMILKKYGLTNFGSSSNIFRLMHEQNGKLTYFGNNPKDNYKQAIECIDKHLEKQKPIIVGVNHTIGRNIKEGTTDHFVVIYGREFDGKHYIFDATMPTLKDEEVSPLVAEIPEEVFLESVKSRTREGMSVEVSHYNPLRSEDINVVYDAGRKIKYDATKKQIVTKK